MAVADRRSSQLEMISTSPLAPMSRSNQAVAVVETSGLLMNTPWETVDSDPWGALVALSSRSSTSETHPRGSTTKGHNISRDRSAGTSWDLGRLKKSIANSTEWAWQTADLRHLPLLDPPLTIPETVLLTHTVKRSRITKHARETSRFFKRSLLTCRERLEALKMKSVLANVITRTASVSKIKLSTIWVVI